MRYRLDASSADRFEGNTKVVLSSEVDAVLDDIESNLYDALKLIECIEGIQDIDKCKFLLKETLMKL